MDKFIDISIRSDPEFSDSTIMNTLFWRFHGVLVKLKVSSVGVSFPGYDNAKPLLGNRLRLHGSQRDLENVMHENWLKALTDHVRVSNIQAVPDNAMYRIVRRVQAKSNPERLRRRQMKRHSLSKEEVRQRLPDNMKAQQLQLPFIQLKSRSSAQHFRLFIEHMPLQEPPTDGEFTTYGLSKSATIPWF